MLQAFLYFVVFGVLRQVIGLTYCNPYPETGTNNFFNFSCLEECYFNHNYPSTCYGSSFIIIDEFVESYLGLKRITRYPNPLRYTGSKNIVNIFNAPPETVISLDSEIDLRYSFNKLFNYTCRVSVKTFDKASDFIKKCFHAG